MWAKLDMRILQRLALNTIKSETNNCLSMIYQENIGEKKKNLPKMIYVIVSYASPNSETMRFEFHNLLYKKKNVVLRKQFLVGNHVTRLPDNLHENGVLFAKEKDASVLHHQHGRRDVTQTSN